MSDLWAAALELSTTDPGLLVAIFKTLVVWVSSYQVSLLRYKCYIGYNSKPVLKEFLQMIIANLVSLHIQFIEASVWYISTQTAQKNIVPFLRYLNFNESTIAKNPHIFLIHNIFKFVEKFLEKSYYHQKVYMSFKSVFDPLSIDM